MPKEEKKRTFESETLILPALKMVLVEAEKDVVNPSAKKVKKKVNKDFNEDTVMRIIDKLIAKE
jgi:NADH dehydrogenase FAD-containing subunit